jgi:hypothetical protein
LGLDRGESDEHAFNRCVRCQTDNGRFVECCERCGASLTTPEQHAFHAQLAQANEAFRKNEVAELEQLRAAREAEAARQATLSLQLLLEKDAQPRDESLSLGRRLLRRIPNPRHRMAVLIGSVVLLLLPWFFQGAGTTLRLISLITFAVLFSPRSLRPRRRRSPFDLWSD